MTFPYNGPMDEFLRKRARNDYTLMTLWELGVRKLRVPISDLLEDDTRARMGALRGMGHEFTVFCFEAPSREAVEMIARHRDLVDVLEIIVPWQDAASTVARMAAAGNSIPVPITLAKMETSAEKKTEGSRFSHFVSYGFRASELALIEGFSGVTGRYRRLRLPAGFRRVTLEGRTHDRGLRARSRSTSGHQRASGVGESRRV